MRFALPLALMIAATPMAEAGPLANGQGCYVRTYSADHLAKHPDQLVRFISLSPVPIASLPGQFVMNLMVNQRGSDDFPSALITCKPNGALLDCIAAENRGRLTISERFKGKLTLTVGSGGLVLAGQNRDVVISGTRGDDRSFLVPQVDGDQCN